MSPSGSASLPICNLTCSLTEEVLGRHECALVKIYFRTDKATCRGILLMGRVSRLGRQVWS